MADFKTALQALSRGELDIEVITSNLEKLLGKHPAEGAKIIEQLREAYSDDTIDAQIYARLKKIVDHVHAPPVPAEAVDADQATVFAGDDSADSDATEILTEGDRDAIAKEARQAATQVDFSGTNTATSSSDTGGIDFDLTGSSWPADGTGQTGTGFAEPAAAQPAAEVKIGPGVVMKERFELMEVLGVGGMGTVYRGIDLIKKEARDRHPYVALKVLNEDFKQHPDSFIALQREASRQQKLAHPNIATVYDFDRTGSTVFLTMELLEGTPLNTFIKKQVRAKGGLPFEEAFPMVEGLGQALIYAHDHNIVHSDFKPGNCFLNKEGVMKVLDFGIARAVKNPGQAEGEKTLFDPGKLGALTPAYASAEMLDGLDPVPPDDIYALACVAYELLTGKHPFNKLPANTARENNLVPAPIKTISRRQMKGLARGLAFDRANRSANTAEFLQEFEGKSNAFKNPLVIGALAAVVVALIAIVPVMNFMHDKKIDGVIDDMQTGDPIVIEERLAEIGAFEPTDIARIKLEARESIYSYYEASVNSDIKAYNYTRADIRVKELRQLFPDARQVDEIEGIVESSRDNLLSELNENFNKSLDNGWLLATSESETYIGEVLEIIRRIDNAHPLLTDPRLSAAFSSESDDALLALDFERAQSLSEAGLALLPKDVNLINLSDKIRNTMEQEADNARVADLESQLESIAASFSSIDDLNGVQGAVVQLSSAAPDSPLIASLSTKLEPMLRRELAAIRANKDWGRVALLNEQFLPMLSALKLDSGIRELDTERNAHLKQVDGLLADLTSAIAANQLAPPASPNATAILGQIASIADGSPRLLQARDQVAQAYLKQARLARAGNDWDKARQQVALAEKIQPSDTLQTALASEIDAIATAEERGEQQLAADDQARLDAERQAQADTLHRQFEQQLVTMEPSIEGAREVYATLDALEAANPTDARLTESRERAGSRLAQSAQQLADADQYTKAISLTRDYLALAPESAALGQTLERLQANATEALANEQQSSIDSAKQNISQLISAATLDRAWDNALQAELQRLTTALSADDAWLMAKRAEIAELYVARAREMREAQRFTEATNVLDRGERIAPAFDSLTAERQQLALVQQAFENERQAELRKAEIEGLKQTLVTQAKVKKIGAARAAFDKLKKILPATDGYLVSEAPDILADAYYAMAQSQAEQKNFASALKFADQGLAIAPGKQQLEDLKREYTVSAYAQDVTEAVKSGTSIDVADLKPKVTAIRRADAREYSRLRREWVKALTTQLDLLRDSQPQLYNSLLKQAQQLFPDSPELAGTTAIGAKPIGPSRFASKIQDFIKLRRLSKAQQELKAALKEEPGHPDVRKAEAQLKGLRREAGVLYTSAKKSHEAKDYEAAIASIGQAMKAWTDNSRFRTLRQEIQVAMRPAAGTTTTPGGTPITTVDLAPAPPSPRPCGEGLAGYGSRKKGTCYDMVADKAPGHCWWLSLPVAASARLTPLVNMK